MTRSINVLLSIILLSLPTGYLLAQEEIDIVPALQKIESGHIESAELLLNEFKSKSPNDPSVLFLDAVLTKDGTKALEKYSSFIEQYPKNQFADAALYRVFSYYYSLGYYKKASSYSERLKKDFPDSPYIRSIDGSLPSSDSPDIAGTNTTSIQKPDTTNVKPEKSVDAKSYNFTIQAGAFIIAENAKNLCERLNKENYFTEITTREIGGSLLNVVNVGKFETEKDAASVLTMLESKYNLKARVVKLNK
jgi:hypothetical protein